MGHLYQWDTHPFFRQICMVLSGAPIDQSKRPRWSMRINEFQRSDLRKDEFGVGEKRVGWA